MKSGSIGHTPDNSTLRDAESRQDHTGLTYASHTHKQEMNITYASWKGAQQPGHDQQPKQLQIQKMQPTEFDKRRSRNLSPFQARPNYSNLIDPSGDPQVDPSLPAGKNHL